MRENAISKLLSMRNEQGHWEGHLSSSALSTATALVALHILDQANSQNNYTQHINAGLQWLVDNQNTDGGWGDTTKSFSNISTTMLCWAALNFGDKTTTQLI